MTTLYIILTFVVIVNIVLAIFVRRTHHIAIAEGIIREQQDHIESSKSNWDYDTRMGAEMYLQGLKKDQYFRKTTPWWKPLGMFVVSTADVVLFD